MTARSDRDAEDFVRYLLEGSGAEGQVDYAALRTELEQSQSQVLLTQQDSRVGSGLFLNPEQSAPLSLSQENLLDSKVNASILSHPEFQESPIQGSSIGGVQQQSYQQNTPTKRAYRAPYAVSDASMTSSQVNNFKTQSEDAKVWIPFLYSY